MQSIRRRLKKLTKTFPPLKDTGPERLSAAALTHLTEEELLLLEVVFEKQERSPVPPLSEPESQAVEAYYKALEFESRQARLAEPRKHRESAK
jgi:hypothetical protein